MIKTPHRESSWESPLSHYLQPKKPPDRQQAKQCSVAKPRPQPRSNILKEIKSVKILYFSLQNTFKSQTQLEYLDLSHNGFEKIQPTYFNNLGRLLWLNVSNNAITEMSGRNFARNSLLRVLHMNHNRISRLDSNSFRGMRFMRRLYFSDNQITDVGRGTFRAVNRYVNLNVKIFIK